MAPNHKNMPQIRRIFEQASELAPGEQREEYLQFACREDRELRDKVERLLEAHVGDHSGLDRALMRMSEIVAELGEAQPADSAPFDGGQPGKKTDDFCPTKVGAFTILDRIGEGGMGIVFRARQAAPISREVALKIIKPGMDSREVLRRFTLEQQALALMEHPNIAQVLSAGLTERAQPYFAMELVRGESITEFCRRNALPLQERLSLFTQVCDAVQHAHHKGIIHRDLKPSNLLVTTVNGSPLVKVIDFGVAKALESNSPERTAFTHLAQFIGSPLYMSPEQVAFDRARIDERSDVFALAAVLYELITESPPLEREMFREAGLEGMRKLIVDEIPPPPSVRLQERFSQGSVSQGLVKSLKVGNGRVRLPRELDWMVMRGLDKEPVRRYATAQALMSDLRNFLAGKPISASPPVLGYRLNHFARRHRATLLPALAVLLLMSVTAAITSRLARMNHRFDQGAAVSNVDKLRDAPGDMATIVQARDELEASALTQQLLALRAQDLARMSECALPRTDAGEFLGSPTAAGRVAEHSASLRNVLRQVAQPAPLLSFEHSAAVIDTSLSTDGTLLATACADQWVRVWDMLSGELKLKLGPHGQPAEAVAFSPDGRLLASGDKDGVIKLWKLPDGQLLSSSAARDGGIESLQWTPNGKFLAAGARYWYVDILSADGSKVFDIPVQKDGPRYENLLFSPDSRFVYVPGGQEGLDVYDLALGTKTRTLKTDPLQFPPRAMTWLDEQGRWLIVGNRGQEFLIVKDCQTPSRENSVIHFGYAHPQELAYNIQSKRLACAYLNGKVVLMDLSLPLDAEHMAAPDKLVFNAHLPEKGKVTSVEWISPERLLTAGEDGFAYVWSLDSLYPWQQFGFENALALIPLGGEDLLLLRDESHGDSPKQVRMELRTLNAIDQPLATAPPNRALGALCGRPDFHFGPECHFAVDAARTVLAVNLQDTIQTYSLPKLVPQHTLTLGDDQATSIAISADGSRLAHQSNSHQLVTWQRKPDGSGFERLAQWQTRRFHRAPQFAGDGNTIYHANHNPEIENLIIEARDPTTGQALKSIRSDGLLDFAVSDDGTLLAISVSAHLRVLEIDTNKVLFESWGSSSPHRVFFADNDRLLICLHVDGVCRAWHVPTGIGLGELINVRNIASLQPTPHFGVWRQGGIAFWTAGRRRDIMLHILGSQSR